MKDYCFNTKIHCVNCHWTKHTTHFGYLSLKTKFLNLVYIATLKNNTWPNINANELSVTVKGTDMSQYEILTTAQFVHYLKIISNSPKRVNWVHKIQVWPQYQLAMDFSSNSKKVGSCLRFFFSNKWKKMV